MLDSIAEAGARIGPNAVTQTAEALRASGGEALAEAIFERAGLLGMLRDPPQAMVPETAAIALHHALAEALPEAEARRIAADAGRRTGDYILKHRIPRPAQTALKLLPVAVAGPLLLRSIARHAWTFAGSGQVTISPGRPCCLTIRANPLAVIPGCPWHTAVFNRLFQTLVSPNAETQEQTCCATGAPACTFVITY